MFVWPKRTTGQILIELAILIPVVLLLTFVVIDLSRLLYIQINLDAAVRFGSRYFAATQSPDPSGRNWFRDHAKGTILSTFNQPSGGGRLGVQLQFNDVSIKANGQEVSNQNWPAQGELIQVQASVNVPFVAGQLTGVFFGGSCSTTLNGRVFMSYRGVT